MSNARLTSVSTVTTAAGSYDLVDLALVKSVLKITGSAEKAYLEWLITTASAAAAQYCNRVFAVESVKDEFWPQRDPAPQLMPGGVAPLQLSRWPLIAVTSVLEDGVALVADTDFKVDAAKGQLLRLGTDGYPRRWPALAMAVEFSAGFDPIPPDLQDATMRTIKAQRMARDRDPGIRAETVDGAWSAQYWLGSGPDAPVGNLTPDIAAILDNYRVPVVA